MGVCISGKLEDGVSRYMLVWGKVTRDAKNTVTSNKAIPKSEFGIAYDRKQFMNVCSLGDTAATAMASALEAGDYVLVGGVWSEKSYTNRNGEAKTYSELRAEIVIPQPSLPAEKPATSPDGSPLSDEPDAFESAGFSSIDEDDPECPF